MQGQKWLGTLVMAMFIATAHGQQLTQKVILSGSQLFPPFDIGIDTSNQRRDWLTAELGDLKFAFPAGQAWGAAFITPGQAVDRSRPSVDMSIYDTLIVEMRADTPGTRIEIGVKTNTQADDGTETKIAWYLSTDWEIRSFPLSMFRGADPARLYVVTEIVFSASTAQTVYLRTIKYAQSGPKACLRPAPEMAAWWPAEGNADDIAGGANGVSGGVTFASGLVGQAFMFDGVHGPVTAAVAPGLDVDSNSTLTLEMWFFRKSSAPVQYLLGKSDGCVSAPTALQMSIGPDGFPPSSVALNSWTHLAMVIDRGTAYYYANGALTARRPLTILHNSAPWTIGSSGTCQLAAALIDEVTIHKRVLTQDEIQDVIGRGSSGRCKASLTAFNSATLQQGPFSPKSFVTLFGSELSTSTGSAASSTLSPSLGKFSVRVIDNSANVRDAGIAFVSPGQANIVMPPDLLPGGAVLVASRDGAAPQAIRVQIAPVAPGIFTANSDKTGVAAAIFQRVSSSGSSSFAVAFMADPQRQGHFVAQPIDWADDESLYLQLFGTGVRSWKSSVVVTIDGKAVSTIGAVPQPQFDGLDQINVGPLPSSLRGRGEVIVSMVLDSTPANPVTVAFR